MNSPNKTIYKYPIEITDTQVVRMPSGAEILSCQVQHGQPVIWALVSPKMPLTRRTLRTFGTGHEVDSLSLRFIDTIQMHSGSLIFHVFEEAA